MHVMTFRSTRPFAARAAKGPLPAAHQPHVRVPPGYRGEINGSLQRHWRWHAHGPQPGMRPAFDHDGVMFAGV
jgi:hypothetical protein